LQPETPYAIVSANEYVFYLIAQKASAYLQFSPRDLGVVLDSHCVILVADDEPAVRHVAAASLKHAGYGVLVAADGTKALQLSRAYEGTIHLLLTDIKMPNLDGPGLAKIIAKERPGIRIIAMTGYSSEHVPSELIPSLIRKPFLPKDLVERVQRELNTGLRTKSKDISAT
jgi:CheY-like chemotaxis protein